MFIFTVQLHNKRTTRKQHKQHLKQHLDNIQNNINNIENFAMNSFDLRDIVNDIMEKEEIDLTTLASTAKANRSYLSKLVNSVEEMKVGPKVKAKIHKAFPAYFPENNTNNARPVQKYEKDYIQLLKDDRTLLAEVIKINLKLVLETLRTVAVRQEADEEVILHSLARLEGKPEKQLFQDAGKRKGQIEKRFEKSDKSVGKHN